MPAVDVEMGWKRAWVLVLVLVSFVTAENTTTTSAVQDCVKTCVGGLFRDLGDCCDPSKTCELNASTGGWMCENKPTTATTDAPVPEPTDAVETTNTTYDNTQRIQSRGAGGKEVKAASD